MTPERLLIMDWREACHEWNCSPEGNQEIVDSDYELWELAFRDGAKWALREVLATCYLDNDQISGTNVRHLLNQLKEKP